VVTDSKVSYKRQVQMSVAHIVQVCLVGWWVNSRLERMWNKVMVAQLGTLVYNYLPWVMAYGGKSQQGNPVCELKFEGRNFWMLGYLRLFRCNTSKSLD
jgi:hypothetical protein